MVRKLHSGNLFRFHFSLRTFDENSRRYFASGHVASVAEQPFKELNSAIQRRHRIRGVATAVNAGAAFALRAFLQIWEYGGSPTAAANWRDASGFRKP
jgi:hypothetical protein